MQDGGIYQPQQVEMGRWSGAFPEAWNDFEVGQIVDRPGRRCSRRENKGMQCGVGACRGLGAGGDEGRGHVGPVLRAACIYGEQASSIPWQ